MQTTGWAVTTETEILVKTVSPTRLAAVINWLVGYSNYMVFQSDTEQHIFKAWEHRRKVSCVKVVEVIISYNEGTDK